MHNNQANDSMVLYMYAKQIEKNDVPKIGSEFIARKDSRIERFSLLQALQYQDLQYV